MVGAREFEDGIAATNLLPGPASTQLAIFCAWRLRGAIGRSSADCASSSPGLTVILALAAVFLPARPPLWILGAAAGASAAVPAVRAARRPSASLPRLARVSDGPRARVRWVAYLIVGGSLGRHDRPVFGAGDLVLRGAARCCITSGSGRPRGGPGTGSAFPPAGAHGGRRRRARRPVMGGLQGRRPLLRRRAS